MEVTGFYCNHGTLSAQNNSVAHATGDFEFDIVPVVEAYSMITAFGHDQGDGITITTGIIEYTTRDPATGVDSTHTVGTLEGFELENLLLANNVVRVTFGALVEDQGGRGFFGSRGDFVNQVWFFD
jgi:hypothetical protein